MIFKGTGYIGVVLFLLCYVFGSQLLMGQREQRYIGPYQVAKYTGKADFGYQIIDQDTVFNGPFLVQRSNLGALLEGEDSSFLIKGQFIQDYPQGPWQFQFGEFTSDSASQVVDYQYRVNVTGIQESASGLLSKGKPDGPWNYSEQEIEASEISGTLFNSSITFKNGIPQQSFRIEDENGTLIGRFLRNGIAHDIWTWFSNSEEEISENWYFKEGRLEKIEKSVDGDVQMVSIYGQPIDNSRTIDIDERFGQILALRIPRKDTTLFFGKGIYGLLAKNLKKYRKIDNILSQLGESQFYPGFKVQVPFFPLDSIQVQKLDSIQSLQQQSDSISRFFLGDTQLNLLKRSDEEAQYLYSVIQTLTHSFVDPLGELVSYHALDALSFLDRVQLFERLFPDGMPSTTLMVKFGEEDSKERSFKGPGADAYSYGRYDLESAFQMAQYVYSSLDSIANILDLKLANERRQQAFVALESEMIRNADLLNRFLDSTTVSSNPDHAKALENIKKVAERALAQYSAMAEAPEKKEAAEQLVTCLGALDKLARSVVSLPEWEAALSVKYQDAVWNPFTATIMNEEVKKRITAAYRNVLVPYFLEKVGTELDCENTTALNSLIKNTYQRILQLRDEDTSKLERKLKREKDPTTILGLFGLKPLAKDN